MTGLPFSSLPFSVVLLDGLLLSALDFAFLSALDKSGLLEVDLPAAGLGVGLLGDLVSLVTVGLRAPAFCDSTGFVVSLGLAAVSFVPVSLVAGDLAAVPLASVCSAVAFGALAIGSGFFSCGSLVPDVFGGGTFEPFAFESLACSSGLGLVL